MRFSALLLSFLIFNIKGFSQEKYNEQYRPQIHFSPRGNWMNDPNGMVYKNGVYHLYFQYYPQGTVWGPMHWGHATSADMINWKEQDVAIYPDSLGYIFSGSAVFDEKNTSGFGKNGKAPLVAVFTQHDVVGEKRGTDTFQTQSIAYSLDDGITWIKYKGNPVLRNPHIKDFRDPKVMWHKELNKWIMTLATRDRITFYSSPNLINWTKESEFGEKIGEHGGVWECPDLISFYENGKQVWVLIVNLNPGGPNGGSATQYFVGDFNGKTFVPFDTFTRWVDYGPDEYAGVTWSNTGSRNVFLGWMNNWAYAEKVPTGIWRGANTIPRDLKLRKVNGKYFLASLPVKELAKNIITQKSFNSKEILNHSTSIKSPCVLRFNLKRLESYECIFFNANGEQLKAGFNKSENQFYIDRSKAGEKSFSNAFKDKSFAPRISKSSSSEIVIVIDNASIEFFADNGLTVLTSVYFVKQPFDKFELKSNRNIQVSSISYEGLKSIWNR